MRRAAIALLIAVATLPSIGFGGGPGDAPRKADLFAKGLLSCPTDTCTERESPAGVRRWLCEDGQPCFPHARACQVSLSMWIADAPGGARSDQICPDSRGCTCGTNTPDVTADCTGIGGTCLPDGDPIRPRDRCQTGTCRSDADCAATQCHCPGGFCDGTTVGRCGVRCPPSNGIITLSLSVQQPDGTWGPSTSEKFENCTGPFASFYCPGEPDPDATADRDVDFFCSTVHRRATERSLLQVDENDLAFQSLGLITEQMRVACRAPAGAVPIIIPPVNDLATSDRSNVPGEQSYLRACFKVYWTEP